MRKFPLSLALLTVSSLFATTITLYKDIKTGALYTTPGKDRVRLGEFVSKEEAEKPLKSGFKEELKIKKILPRVIDENSPDFLLGKATKPNMIIRPFDNPDMYLKLGVRVQGTFEKRDIDYKDATKMDKDYWDAYLRRVRFEVTAGFSKHVSFTMDIRNDKANYQDKGEQEFNVGDAYLKIKKPFGSSLVNFKLYRAKIDVSRTETVKSAYVIHYDRPHVADEAAQYITHNRRGTNVQAYGDWEKKIHYQTATGDGIYSGKFHDAKGHKFTGSDFLQKSYFYGAKVVLSPFDGWEEKKRTETYFGRGKHFEVGAAYWVSPDIEYLSVANERVHLDHKLLNLEMSAHYKSAFIQAEYFKFDDMVKDFTAPKTEIGTSSGWYVTGEYVLPQFYYIAPFARYEKWDRWDDESGYNLTSRIFGINWYLRGNSTKVGLSYQKDSYDVNIGNYDEKRIKLTTQWFF